MLSSSLLRLPRAALAAVLALSLAACAATAHFHSRTGLDYAPVAVQAVRCDEGDVKDIQAAGGVPIGTIDAKALTVQATDEDLADKAAKEAAEHGGTHIVLTEKGIDSFTYVQPGQAQSECHDEQNGDRDCRVTVTAPSETTVEKPTAKFIVFRVPPNAWGKLPAGIRPVAAN